MLISKSLPFHMMCKTRFLWQKIDFINLLLSENKTENTFSLKARAELS